MPTYNRRAFVSRAIEYFLRQDYANKELIVVDDGSDPIGDLVPSDERIRYIRLKDRITVGAKRNRAIEAARGDLIAHWDDDDWHAAHRITYQVEALVRERAEVCGINNLLFYDILNEKAWRYIYPSNQRFWLSGSTLCYTRSFWNTHHFADVNVGEDTRFVRNGTSERMIVLSDATFHVGVIHANNVSPKRTRGVYWQPYPIEQIQRIMGNDFPAQRSNGAAVPLATSSIVLPLISCIMPTRSRRAFVALAVQRFLEQDYPNTELIVADDGDDAVDDLLTGVPNVRYVRLTHPQSIGAKRNRACREARGEIIAHWDDDDWYASNRLSYQAAPLLTNEADLTGLENTYVLELPDIRFWTIGPQLHHRMFVGNVHGGTLVFRKKLWDSGVRYPEVNIAEDAGLLRQALNRGYRLTRLANPGVFVYVRHRRNAWQFQTGQFLDPDSWHGVDPPSTFPADILAQYQAAAEPTANSGPRTIMLPSHTSQSSDLSVAAYLDTLPLLDAKVGYGALGLHGNLGYEGKYVMVRGQHYSHALSTHPPARLAFQLDRRFTRFSGQVAINDDVPARRSWADFSVKGDGRLIGIATRATAGDAPRLLEIDVRGVDQLELVVTTDRWEFSHAVWLDPLLDSTAPPTTPKTLPDCLDRTIMVLPDPIPHAARCIATVASKGYADSLDDMLGSLHANGQCPDARLVVCVIDDDADCVRVAQKYGATIVRCTLHTNRNVAVKAVLYSIARVIDADQFVCLDADMLVLGDLQPVFAALDACSGDVILACREGNNRRLNDLQQALREIYFGSEADAQRLFQQSDEGAYPLVVNDGLFAGSRAALLALDEVLRSMLKARDWMDGRGNMPWRNQFVFNLALARLKCGVELNDLYNLQLHVHDVEWQATGGRPQAMWHQQAVRVLHFSGNGRRKYPEWRNLFAKVPDPLIGFGGGDAYAAFLTALRAWVGRHGLSALAWSFYGTADAKHARVNDVTVLPLLAALHYLIRSNGCVRVIETGTARGVSAACLASAVAHRSDAQVVTLDPLPNEARLDLWASLPASLKGCIKQRVTGSIEGMHAAVDAGERYEAALLDSIHTEEHVWAEFELAAQLVCRGGLILIHDARYRYGTVDRALKRIEAAGYNIVRLWCAEGGVPEDDQLGLAVIENRQR